MYQTNVTVAATPYQTNLLVTCGKDELLRAILPGAPHLRNIEASSRLLQGLSLWLDQRLHVALFVDEPEGSLYLGLTDELGIGDETLYYKVKPIEFVDHKNRTLRGVGDFRKLYFLARVAKQEGLQ